MLPSEDGSRAEIPRLSGGWRLAAAVSLGIAVLIPIVQFVWLFPLTVNIPTWDQWSFVPIWRAYYSHRPVLPRLAEPYNGHIIFLPRLVFFALGLLTRWNVRAEIVATYIVMASILGIFLTMLARSDRRLLILAAPVSAYLFYLDQAENFLTGIALCETLAVLGIVASIFLLTGPRLSLWRFVLALASAIAASLSWGVGNVVWPTGLLALLLRRDRRRLEAAVWGLTGAFWILAAQRIVEEVGIQVAPRKAALFLLALLGRPFSFAAIPSVAEARSLGAGVIVIFSVLVLTAFPRRELSPWVVIGLSGLGAAILIALARSEDRAAGNSTSQALASHYVLAVYPLAVAVLAMAARFLLRWRDRLRRKTLRPFPALVLAMLVAASLCQTAAASWAWLPAIRSSAATVSQSKRAVLSGTINDRQIRESLHPNVFLVREGIEALHQYRLACFAVAGKFTEPDAIGPPVGNVDFVAGVRSTPGGRIQVDTGRAWDIVGWAADDAYAGRPVERLDLFIDGKWVASAELGVPRRRLAQRNGSARFLNCGWRIPVPGSALGEPKEYRLEIRVRDRRGKEARFWTGTIRARAPTSAAG